MGQRGSGMGKRVDSPITACARLAGFWGVCFFIAPWLSLVHPWGGLCPLSAGGGSAVASGARAAPHRTVLSVSAGIPAALFTCSIIICLIKPCYGNLWISHCIPSPKDTRVSACPLKDSLGFISCNWGLCGLTHCCFIDRCQEVGAFLGHLGWFEEDYWHPCMQGDPILGNLRV